MDHHNSSSLKDISPNIKRYPYKGKEQFQEIMSLEHARLQNGNASEWVLFEVDKQTFTRDFLIADETSWSSFDAVENLLLAMSMTFEHTAASTHFEKMLDRVLVPMNLQNALQPYAGTVVEGGIRIKKPDRGWSPVRLPRGRSKKWPAVVLEVAVSESQPKLQSDVRFWLHESQGEVRIILTLAVNHKVPEIMIQKWELQDNRPHCTQQATVYKGENNRVYVRGVLSIEFDKLFLRATTIPRETDIQFPETELKALAETIWLWQEFPGA